MSEFIEILSTESKKDLDQFIKDLERGVRAVKEINEEFRETKIPSQAHTVIQKTNREIKQSNGLKKEAERLDKQLQREQNKLAMAYSGTSKNIAKARYESQQIRAAQKREAIGSSRLASAYDKLSNELNQNKRQLKDLLVQKENGVRLTNKQEKEIEQLTRAVNKQDAALKRVDKSVGESQRNVGNYRSAWGGVKDIMMASVAAFGIYEALNIGRQIFNQIKEINSLNAELRKVTDTQEEFNQAQIFVSALADRSGVGINSLQRAYTKFYAVAKNTNLTLSETQEIFENVTMAGATMGLATEDIAGALRALEQMLSKGNIQAEEIRGQLSERLPGAFKILADSMGLSTQQLNKQLELGNVLAEEVLPKFAKQLKEAYDLEGRIDTLVAAQGRLSNAWIEFVSSVDDGSGTISTAFKEITDTLTWWIKAFTSINQTEEDVWNKTYQNYYSKQIDMYDKLGEKAEGYAETMKLVSEKNIEEAKNSIEEIENILRADDDKFFSMSLMKREDYEEELASLRKFLKRYEAEFNAANFIIFQDDRNEQNLIKEIMLLDKTATAAELCGLSIEELGEKLKGLSEKNKLSNDKLDKKNLLLAGTVAFYEELISSLKKERDTLATSTDEYIRYNAEIAKANENLRELKGLADSVNELGETEGIIQEETPIEAEIAPDDAYVSHEQKKTQTTKEEAEKRRQIIFDSLQTIGDYYGIDLSKFEALFQKKELTVEDYAVAAKELLTAVGNAIFQGNINRINAEIAANAEKYDMLIRMAEGNEAQQEALRREEEKRRKQLMTQRAREEKQAALFNAIINGAAATVRAFVDGGVVLGAIVAALSAAQVAIIAAQPIPQYKRGRKGGKEEMAIIGDGGKNEPVLDKKGNLKYISPNKPTLTKLESGDTVLPDMSMLNGYDIERAAIMTSLAVGSHNLSQSSARKEFDYSIIAQGMKKEIVKSLRQARFINQNNVNIDLDHAFKRQNYN